MDDSGAESTQAAGRISRAPVFVVVGGLGLAIALVFLGARLAAAPAPPPDLSQPGTADEPRELTVIMRDYLFNPTPVYLVPGEYVRINVLNGGLIAHELVLGDLQVQQAWARAHASAPSPAPFASPPLVEVPPGTGGLRVLLGSGETTSVVYEVPQTGELALICHLPGHAERGMVGTVELAER